MRVEHWHRADDDYIDVDVTFTISTGNQFKVQLMQNLSDNKIGFCDWEFAFDRHTEWEECDRSRVPDEVIKAFGEYLPKIVRYFTVSPLRVYATALEHGYLHVTEDVTREAEKA